MRSCPWRNLSQVWMNVPIIALSPQSVLSLSLGPCRQNNSFDVAGMLCVVFLEGRQLHTLYSVNTDHGGFPGSPAQHFPPHPGSRSCCTHLGEAPKAGSPLLLLLSSVKPESITL